VADIFVSYTSSDREWAFWLAKELEVLGHSPHVHEWEIKGGDDIYAWMEQRHDAADHVLCVVSDDYLKAPYSTLEHNAALWQAASKRPGFVLLVAVKSCRLPTLSDHMRRCVLFGIPQDAARLRFREFMSVRSAPATVAFPGKVFAISNIPIRVPEHFLGRDDTLAAIETALARYEGRVAITALHGLRGVGKTTLAAVYADRHRGDYRATWWVRAQTEITLRADLVRLGNRLGWVGADDKEEPAVAAVMERLRHEGEGILLIYDNAIDADSLRPYLPRGGVAKVLVTSNAHAWRGVAALVEILLWPKEIGADYLIARTGRERERAAAESLSEALGGLPLAHEQAAAYCERLYISLAEYGRRFTAMPTRLLDDERYASPEYYDGRTVAKTFALAIEQAAKLHAAAEPLIVRAALLAPEPIPLFLFAEAREKFGKSLATAFAGDGVDKAVAALRTFALVDRESIVYERDPAITSETIRLHRLVREVAAARLAGDARAEGTFVPRSRSIVFRLPPSTFAMSRLLTSCLTFWRRSAATSLADTRRALIAALAAVYPDDAYNNPTSWPRCAALTPHALALCRTEAGDAAASQKSAQLLNKAGSYFHGRAAYAAARPLFERTLAIYEKVLGPEHPDTAMSLNDLASLFKAQGDLAGARPLFERALTIYEKVLGPQHPDTALSLNNLASLFSQQGDLARAKPLFERALTIYEKLLGAEHPSTAMTLNNLAYLLQDQGDLAGARPLLERALAIYEKALGPEHPSTATTLDNLAYLLQDQGNLAGARPLLERTLAIREKAFGPEHRDTATSLSNLARLLRDSGHADEAEPLFRRAIDIGQNVLSSDHTLTQRFSIEYARLLLCTGRAAVALEIAQPALTVHDAAFGPSHPWTKNSARVTANALNALDRNAEAVALRARYGIGSP
jgi:tetratricopeptide (TPR) repeat protein